MSDELTKGSPWDVFIHLLAVIALYASVVGTLMLLFQYINLAFPDSADREMGIRDSIREGAALLLIFFPAYAWAWRSIELDLAANPSKRRLWVRTCPMYLTLFLAGMLALGDLACLVYYLMGGDLTSRFVLKVGAILLVSGSVLWFYLTSLHREPGPLPAATRAAAYAAAVAAVVLVAAGFATVGSPSRARSARFDAERIENLQKIQNQLVDYWQSKAVLPASLDELKDPISGFSPARDPQSAKPYGYRAMGPSSFELCADFGLRDFDTQHSLPPWLEANAGGGIWNHQAGHVCFTRTIDPKRHPPHAPPPSGRAP